MYSNLGRRAWLQVLYENVDITADLQPYLLNWTYTDNLSGQADDLQITLADREHLWSGPWMPEVGASISAKILREHWQWDGQKDSLNLGQFEVDELEVNMPPSTVTIKALSIPQTTASLRGQRKNRAWEKTKLSVIAKDISNKAKLKLYYDVDDDPEYDRVEQTEETDLEFLSRLCNDAGLCLKITGTQIAIFDEEKYERKPPALTIKKGESYIKSFSARLTLNGLYKACRVEYHDPDKKKTIRYTFTPPNPPKTDRVLVVNEQVSSVKEAMQLAKKRLRQENKNAVTFSMTMLGDIRMVAGLTVNLAGFGKFDGKYIITKVTHSQGQSGYETALELRRCLEGY